MRLIFDSSQVDTRFLLFVKRSMVRILQDELAKKDTRNMNKYLLDNIFTEKRKFTVYQILMMGLVNLKISKDAKNIIMELDKVKVIPYYHDLKICDICELIDVGNLDIKGTKVLTKVFRYVRDNINTLKSMYELAYK